LHNFTRNSKLRDHEFGKRDGEDEDYLPTSTQAQGDDEPEVDSEESMNRIRIRIANALVMAREKYNVYVGGEHYYTNHVFCMR
jgi:hypothetical protein